VTLCDLDPRQTRGEEGKARGSATTPVAPGDILRSKQSTPAVSAILAFYLFLSLVAAWWRRGGGVVASLSLSRAMMVSWADDTPVVLQA
jgi:hypothetical protein